MDISVEEANAYHTLRGNEDWLYFGTDAEKMAALYRASDYIRANYNLKETDAANALGREAIIRLAPEIDKLAELRAASAIKTKKESLDGVLSEETTYFDVVASGDPFPDLTAFLSRVVISTSYGKGITVIKVVR
ncbi:hypothetical protein [Sphingobium lactosutens]|uniref:hypothetical protein n=1 Tax=Sphingobium lactosutens TaxID=522773 RepID=UPI001D18A649|nr:hypothetical protein [Sphingobium lactosutens]MCC4257000.1 hypothetical protein [Sphingobium lactosutens]